MAMVLNNARPLGSFNGLLLAGGHHVLVDPEIPVVFIVQIATAPVGLLLQGGETVDLKRRRLL